MNEFLNNFMYAFNAIMPIVILIFLGYFLNKIHLIGDKFFELGTKFSFKVALPTFLFCEVYSVKSILNLELKTSAIAVVIILILFLIGCIVAKLFISDDKQKGVVLQCAYRSNFAVIGLTLAKGLQNNTNSMLGTGGTVEVLTAITIPLFNVLACIALSMFVSKTSNNKIDWKNVGLKIVKNPLIIGIFLGIVCLVIREFIPISTDGTRIFTIKNNLPVIYSVIEKVANIAPGFMMITLGGQFQFSHIKGLKKQITIATLLRVVVAPVIGLTLAFLCSRVLGIAEFNAQHYIAFIALFGSPVAASSAIMAKEMGNDDKLANQLVLWTSVASVFSVFALVIISRTIGLI